MMARSSKAPSIGRIQKRKTNFPKSSFSTCNARPVHTDGPKSCREHVQQKSTIERQVMSLTDSAYCGTLANACRPRSVMMYNERCSLCGSSVTYCSSTKRASPARDSGELTLGPRSPAARNAFRNQISSLVKSKPTLAVPLRNPAATSTSGFNYAVFQPRQLYRPISLRFSSYSARSISPRARR